MLQLHHRAPTARASRFASLPFRPHALAAGLLFALAAPVQADDLGATDLDAVVVEGVRDVRGAGSVSSATRLDLTPLETPQSASVIRRGQMDDFALAELNEVLNFTSGVMVEQVETDRTYYSARGFDITNFQRDGLGIPLPYGIQDGAIDTALFERIEVLRGANGLLSSTGNPSATVNLVRKRPDAEPQAAARLTLGSWDYRRVDLDASGPLNEAGTVRVRGVAAWQEGDSHLDRYSQERQVLYGVVETDLGPSTVLAAGASRQENRPNAPLWGALPLFYSDGTPTDYLASTSTAADWAYWDTDDTRAFVDLTHRFAGGWNLRAAFNYERVETDSQLFYVFGTPDPDTELGLMAYPSDYAGRFSARYADVYATGPVTLGGRVHDVVFGASWARGDNAETSWFGNDIGTPLPPLQEWDGRYPKPEFNAFSDGSSFDYARESMYATVRWNLADRFKLITGTNLSRVETTGFSYGERSDAEETRSTPFAGAVLDLGRRYAAYASYGEIFAQQSEIAFDGSMVGPVTGSSAEMGLKGQWRDGRLNASAAVFHVRQDNLAEYAGYDTDNLRSYYFGQDSQSRGVELEIAGQLNDSWQLSAGYAHQDVEASDGSDARTFIPRNLLRIAATVQVPQLPGLRLGATLRWQDDIHRDAVAFGGSAAIPVRIRQDAYALVGLMAGYDFGNGWSTTLNLDNVTDEKYITSLYWEQGYYGAPRNTTVSVAYRF